MLQDLIDKKGTLPIVGSGCYAAVYEVGDDKVLKVAEMDGTGVYIEWCHERLAQFGADSPEMHGLPVVYEYQRVGAGWAAIMERYDHTMREVRDRQEDRHGPVVLPDGCVVDRGGNLWSHSFNVAAFILAPFKDSFSDVGVEFNDCHYNNIMWSSKRGQWIVTDPSSSDHDEIGMTPSDMPSAFGPHRL
jgi:hypothetical protein